MMRACKKPSPRGKASNSNDIDETKTAPEINPGPRGLYKACCQRINKPIVISVRPISNSTASLLSMFRCVLLSQALQAPLDRAMLAPIDIILLEDDGGRVIAHHPDCPMVTSYRREGKPVSSIYRIAMSPLPDIRQHDCLLQGTFSATATD
jgi:hypothetical protein